MGGEAGKWGIQSYHLPNRPAGTKNYTYAKTKESQTKKRQEIKKVNKLVVQTLKSKKAGKETCYENSLNADGF